eukprot:COSAG04_NODE_12136_length_668_cov_1.049209_1_plen_24_part_10
MRAEKPMQVACRSLCSSQLYGAKA